MEDAVKNVYKLSVVVPVYNVEKYLDRCVQSILSQTLKDIEIVLVDDGSPDNCPALCDGYADRYLNVRVLHKANAGLGMACNTGIDAASGDYIAFVDSDDWVDTDMFETMLDEAVNTGTDCVITGLKRVDVNGNLLGLMHHPDIRREYHGDEIKELMRDYMSSPPSHRYDHEIQVSAKVVLYRKEIIEKNNIRFVSERLLPSEDLQFNLDYLAHCNAVSVLHRFFYNYMVNENSITNNIKADKFLALKRLYAELADKVKKYDLGHEGTLRMKRFFIGESRALCRQIARSSMGEPQKVMMIREITGDNIWCEVFKDYPVSKMPIVHKIFVIALRSKSPRLTKLISRL